MLMRYVNESYIRDLFKLQDSIQNGSSVRMTREMIFLRLRIITFETNGNNK